MIKAFQSRLRKLKQDRRAVWVGYALIGVALAVLPFAVDGGFGRTWVRIVDFALIYAMLALGLNIVVGFAGLLDLGYIAFYAVGAYTWALLASPQFGLHLPFWAILPIGAGVAAFFGVLLGAPTLRLRGDYLAIVTLGFGEIIRLLFLSDWLGGYTGAAQGVTNIPGVNVFGLATVKGTNPQAVFYLVAAFCAIAIYVSWRLEKSRLGRAWMAVREDESGAEAMGVNTVNVKRMAFVVGAVLGADHGVVAQEKAVVRCRHDRHHARPVARVGVDREGVIVGEVGRHRRLAAIRRATVQSAHDSKKRASVREQQTSHD